MSCMTVLGKKDVQELGIVTPHEHIFIDMSVFFCEPEEIGAKVMAHGPVTMEKLGVLKRNPFAVLDNVQLMDYETQKTEIQYFQAAGGRTVVDASNHGLGRDPELLRRIAVETGLNVITGSGYYVEGAQSPAALELTVEQMEEDIVRDLTVGIGHSGIRAGYIGEIGVSHILFPFEKKSLTAACRAQKRTNAPLMIHINPWSTKCLQAMEIVEAHSIDLKKVVICHSDVEDREDYIFQLLDKGVYALMAFCTEVLIDWVKIQKKHAEQAWNGGAYPHAIEIPDGFGGVAFSDDDVTAIGCEQYRVFAVPYNERVLAAFGGGSVHFCGSAHHQLDTLTRMTGLFAVNNFCMGDFSQIRRLQERIPSPGALMACDFNAADIPWHRSRLASLAERPEGLVLAVFVTPGMALLDSGKYAASDRSEEEILSAYSRPF